jgi:hypothetical protein
MMMMKYTNTGKALINTEIRNHTESCTYHSNGPNRRASDRTKRNLSKNRNSEKIEGTLVVAVGISTAPNTSKILRLSEFF